MNKGVTFRRCLHSIVMLAAIVPLAEAHAISPACARLSSDSFPVGVIFQNASGYANGPFAAGDSFSISVASLCPMFGCGPSTAFSLVDVEGNTLAGPFSPSYAGTVATYEATGSLDSMGVRNLGIFPIFVASASCTATSIPARASVPALGLAGLLAMSTFLGGVGALFLTRSVRS